MLNFNFGPCEFSELMRLRQAEIRAHRDRPRCILCGLDITYGWETAQMEIPKEDVVFQQGDLVCFWCFDSFNREQDQPSRFNYGRA